MRARDDGLSAKTPSRTTRTPVTATKRFSRLCLVVHDDLELRLRFAGLVRRTAVKLDADTLTVIRVRQSLPSSKYAPMSRCCSLWSSCSGKARSDPLALVARLHARAPRLPIFVFARHGDERAAARAIKSGANDYWPIHSVDLAEFSAALQPFQNPLRGVHALAEAGHPIATRSGRLPDL